MHNASFGLALEERHNNSVCRILFYYWVPLISRGGLVLFSFIIAFKGIQETSSRYYDQNQIFLYFFYICKTRRRLQLIHSAEVYLVRGYLPRFSYYRHP